ncbi:hypothetical protein FHS79_003241 [Polymorphobacter multimanifer]|uniref:DUF2568 domain-containing protein n=3 Tax=Polymorphobacter multimanifer TaxID=1070431 RepID=A0A841LDG1_9SPHN|nr:hypothetical protein [Polymorphobacter multimanifer]
MKMMDTISRNMNSTMFLRLLLIAGVIETTYLIGLFERRMAVDGLAMALAFTIVIPWVPYALGWAVVTWRSRIAAAILVALTALAWVAGVAIGTANWFDDAVLLVGALATIFQTLATLMLLSPAGRTWMERR